MVVELVVGIVELSVLFDVCDIVDCYYCFIGIGLEYDFFKLFGFCEMVFSFDSVLKLLFFGDRWCVDLVCGDLNVLIMDCIDEIGGCYV